MKRLFCVFLCLISLFSFSVSVFAETTQDVTTDLAPTPDKNSLDDLLLNNILTGIQNDILSLETGLSTLNDTVSTLSTDVSTLQASQSESTVSSVDEVNPNLADDLTLVGINTYSLNPITPQNTTGLKSVIVSLIGNYDAVVVEYEYQKGNGESSFLRQIQPDYVFLCSCGIFLVVIYCTFRIGGALLRG